MKKDELTEELPGKPKIIARDNHTVSRKNIDMDALKVIRRLQSFGYQAFLVGGGVRDLLLGKDPKDFDVSTSASPEDIRDLFRNSRIIGRRFKLVHVYFKGGKIIEVSTFRANVELENPETLAHDNTFGDAQSDALRRDLTINGLFYNPETFTVIDYVGGMDDLHAKIVRIIGKPDLRFKEDPVRIIRAVRHAARIGFEIEPQTLKSIKKNAGLLSLVPTSRLYEEVLKDLYSGKLSTTFNELYENELTAHIFPNLDEYQRVLSKKSYLLFIERLKKLDELVISGKDPLTELFFASFIIGHYVQESNDETDNSAANSKSNICLLCQNHLQLKRTLEGEIDIDSVSFKLPPVSVKRNNRERMSGLARELGKWFEPVTLTKREKAAIERLLVIRFKLLTCDDESFFDVQELIDSIHHEEKLHLKWLLAIVGDELTQGQEKILSGKGRSARPRNRISIKSSFPIREGNF